MGELPRKWIVDVCCKIHMKLKKKNTVGQNAEFESRFILRIKRHNICKQKQNFEMSDQA
jgi:hypothetical protein